MIGRDLNLQKARELALAGDLKGMTEEVLDNVVSESEWNEIEETWLKDTYCESPEDGKTHNIEKVDLKEFYCVGAVRDKVGKVVKLCEDIALHSIINNTT